MALSTTVHVAALDGTVSHGTMLERDLIPAFLDVATWIGQALSQGPQATHADVAAWLERAANLNDMIGREVATAGPDWYETETAADACALLFDLLDDAAPEGFYFGAHPGDGSDYGFWSCDDDAADGE